MDIIMYYADMDIFIPSGANKNERQVEEASIPCVMKVINARHLWWMTENLCIVGRMKEPGLLEKDARW